MEKARPSRSPSRPGAFTLIELTLVVAIIAIVSAIAVPRFTGNTVRYQLDAAARRVAGDIQLAQQEAIATSSSRTITFSFSPRSYTITRLADDGTKITVATVALADAPYGITKLTAMIAGNASTPITFDGFGKPNGTGAIQIRIGDERRNILLDGITGKTTVTG